MTLPLLFVFLFQLAVINGGQVALRTRPKAQLSARSVANDVTLFDPTAEETFYVSGGRFPWLLMPNFTTNWCYSEPPHPCSHRPSRFLGTLCEFREV